MTDRAEKRIAVFLTKKQHEYLKDFAEKRKMTMSESIRIIIDMKRREEIEKMRRD